MTTAVDTFDSEVRDSNGTWPALPEVWSYSSLKEAEQCPRRWALRRASFPDLWDRAGYPPRPSLASLVGDVVHGALELILVAMHDARCESPRDPRAVDVLRSLGGYSQLAERLVLARVDSFTANPRVISLLPTYRRRLLASIPDIRLRIQELISRANFGPPRHGAGASHRPAATRAPLGPGSYPEIELRAPALRFAGRVDVLTVEADGCLIVDYKTGDASPSHAEQLRTYALLWDHDQELNPTRLPVVSLVASYPRRDVNVEVPQSMRSLAEELKERVDRAEVTVRERPPVALTGPETCLHCEVRQLCSEFWMTQPQSPTTVLPGEFFDLQAAVVSRNGPRSWTLHDERSDQDVLVRTHQESTPLAAGNRVRILNLLRGDDPETPMLVASMTSACEVFLIA